MRSFKYSVKWFWLPLRIALGVTKPRRQIPGGYFAGEIESLGKDVTTFSVGDQVFGTAGLRFGAYGEYVALPARYTIVAKPNNMSFAEAAAVPLGGLNALHFMRRAKIQVGEQVLINGAGGSIGAHAVQIAKSMGAEVTAVDSAIKKGMLRRIGADHFIDYTKEDFARSGQTYDVVFDMVPGSSYTACIEALRPNGRYLSGNPRLSVMLRCPLTTRFTNKTASFAFAAETKEELLALKEMTEAGTSSQQLRRRVVGAADLVAPLLDLAGRVQEPVHRARRAEIGPLVAQRGVPCAGAWSMKRSLWRVSSTV